MKVDARRRDEAAREMPEVNHAEKDEEARGGHEELAAAITRIREAVRKHDEPQRADIELAQRYLGNAAVAALLSGRDIDEPEKKAEEDEVKEAKCRVTLFVREKYAHGSHDPGAAFVLLEGIDKKAPLYGFHPQRKGPESLRAGGAKGEIKREPDQLVDTVRAATIEVDREQLESIRAQAEAFRDAPPKFDFWKWNSVDFVTELLTHAGVDMPDDAFEKIADPEEMRRLGLVTVTTEVVMEEDDSGGDGGEEPPPDDGEDEEDPAAGPA